MSLQNMDEPFNPYTRKSYQLDSNQENVIPSNPYNRKSTANRNSYNATPYDRSTYKTLNPDARENVNYGNATSDKSYQDANPYERNQSKPDRKSYQESSNPYERNQTNSYQESGNPYERNQSNQDRKSYQESSNPYDRTSNQSLIPDRKSYQDANPYDRKQTNSYQESGNPYERKSTNPDRKSYQGTANPYGNTNLIPDRKSYTSTPQDSSSRQSWTQERKNPYSPERLSSPEKPYSNSSPQRLSLNSPKLPETPHTNQSASPKKSYLSLNPYTPINLSYNSPNPQHSTDSQSQYTTPVNQASSNERKSTQYSTPINGSPNRQESANPYKSTPKASMTSPQSFSNDQRKTPYDSPNNNPYNRKDADLKSNPYHSKTNSTSSNPYQHKKTNSTSSPYQHNKTNSASSPYQHNKTDSTSSNPYEKKNDYISASKSPKIIINDDPVIPDYIIQKTFKKQANYNMKIVVVGDGGCGKTCLLVAYAQNKFPEIYVPTVFENYVTNVVTPNNKILELALWDTAGQEEYDRLRPLSYPDADVILICFALDNLTSLQNVKDIWFPEISHFCPGIPIILVGTKSDLPSEIDPDLPMQLATEINAIGYIQCSAKNMFNIKTIFNFACNHYQKQMELQEQLDKSSKHRLSKVLGNSKSVDTTHSRKKSSISKGHFKSASYESTLLLNQPLEEDDYSKNPYGNFGANKVNAPKYNEDEFAFTRKNEKKKKRCVIL